jgi:hypothetical protein
VTFKISKFSPDYSIADEWVIIKKPTIILEDGSTTTQFKGRFPLWVSIEWPRLPVDTKEFHVFPKLPVELRLKI